MTIAEQRERLRSDGFPSNWCDGARDDEISSMWELLYEGEEV